MDYLLPSDSFVQAIDVHTLLPQQEPFVMIGRLVHFDMKETVSSLTITEDNLFFEKGRLQATGLAENIAQTCAARIGYINKYIKKKGVDIGVIGAIRDLVVYDTPEVGKEIMTHVVVEEEVFGMILAKAWVTCEDRTLVETTIKIAVRNEDA